LSDFGKPSGFYNRQIKTLSVIAASQADAVDVDTGVPVGKIPHFDEMVAFFKDPTTQPRDRTTLIHGDYKMDNLVFHSTEPQVVGILEYVCGVAPL
jgi:aminoglycoside phosphotransferase (APT) family kinase protein